MKLIYNNETIQWLAMGIPNKEVDNIQLVIDGANHILENFGSIEIDPGKHKLQCDVYFTDGTIVKLKEEVVDFNFKNNARMMIAFSKKSLRATNSMHSVKNWLKVLVSFGTIPFTAIPSDYHYNKLGDAAFKLYIVKSR